MASGNVAYVVLGAEGPLSVPGPDGAPVAFPYGFAILTPDNSLYTGPFAPGYGAAVGDDSAPVNYGDSTEDVREWIIQRLRFIASDDHLSVNFLSL